MQQTIVLDSSESDLLRGTLALILGTLKDEEAHSYLLDALTETKPGGELTKWFLYALGAWNERPDFDERFTFQPDGPWVVESPGGLRLPIRTFVDDPAVLDIVEDYLVDAEDGELRRVALRPSRKATASCARAWTDGVRLEVRAREDRRHDAVAVLLPEDMFSALARHLHGEWGEVDAEDWQANEVGMAEGEATRKRPAVRQIRSSIGSPPRATRICLPPCPFLRPQLALGSLSVMSFVSSKVMR